MSAAVTTALTPGKASAFVASIERMRACACGERMTLPHSMPGIAMSAPYIARPVTFGTPSGRIGRVPTHFHRAGAISFTASLHSSGQSAMRYRRATRQQMQERPDNPEEENHGAGSKTDRHRARRQRQGYRQDRRAAASGQPARTPAHRRLRDLVDRQDAGRQYL